MAVSTKTKSPKSRSKKYEPKPKFRGTFEDMINISITGAGAKKAVKKAVK